MRLVIVLLTLFCTSISGYAQEFNFEWDSKKCMQSESPYFEIYSNGIASSDCRCVILDKDGYVWIGTTLGISRYDGVHFQNFDISTITQNKTNNIITTLYEDTILNCIWATSDQIAELICLDKKTYKIKTIAYDSRNLKTRQTTTNTTRSFNTLLNYNDSLLLCSTYTGFYLVNKNNGIIQGPYLIDNNKVGLTTHFLDLGETVYFCTNGKLVTMNKNSIYEPEFITIKTDIPGKIRHIDQLTDSVFVLTSEDQHQDITIWLYNRYTKHSKWVHKLTDRPKEILCMHDGIWITTNYGLCFYNLRKEKLLKYTTRNSSLMSNKVYGLARSKNQPIMWIGSSEGLVKNDYLSSKFSRTDLRRFSESNSCDIFTIHKDKNKNYWIWCADGLFVKRNNSEMFSRIDFNNEHIKQFATIDFAEDTIQNCLYLVQSRSISKVDLNTFELSTVISRKNNYRIKFSKIDPSNRLITCTSDNGYIVTQNGKSTFKSFDKSEIGIPSDITFNKDSIMWLGDNNGDIFKINLYTDSISFVTNVGNNKCSITNIRYINRNGLDELWIATNNRGLYYYLPKYNRVNNIEYSSLLVNNKIICLEIDKYKNIWAATSKGLVCINNNDGQTYEYKASTHNICPTFNTNASSTSYDGHVLMAGTNYFIEFSSEDFSENEYYPSPIISSYRFANSTTSTYDELTSQDILYNSDTINVPKGIRSLHLYVRVLNYNNSSNNKIMWRLPNSEHNEWHSSLTTSPILFGALRHGISPLELRSCDNNGNPTNNSRFVYINKDVYFYEHPAFYVLLVLISISLFIFVFFIKNRVNIRQRQKLEEEVNRQAGEIRLTNIALTNHKNIIDQQNRELKEQKNNLEKEVASRTADLKEAFARAEESSRLKSAFLANLSHEVRTPMNCIMGFSKLIAENLCSQEEIKEYAHLIRESGNSLLVLINDLLDISRIESGHLRINFSDFSIYQEIAETYTLLQVERKNENVKFLLSNDDILKDKTICSDKDRFRQIIINIVYNAFKFTESGYVKINATTTSPKQLRDEYEYPKDFILPKTQDLLIISIEDTGVGIPNDKLNVIFEPFRKLNTGNKSIHPGLGLGLNIVKNLVTHMGGQIWVTSEEGQGTTFYFYLPFQHEK